MKEFVERLIDSIEKRKEIILSHDVIDAEDEAMVFAYNETINIIKFFAEKYKDGWIPCSERLPKDLEHIYITGSLKEKSLYEDVLGETKSTDCFYGYYRDGKFYGYTEEGVFWLLDAKAWQPLSEPYKYPDGYWEEFQFLSSTWMHGSKVRPEIKKVELELPNDMVLPEGCELPEIELASAILKRTIIQDDGRMVEIDETIEVPIIQKEDK